MTMTFEEADAVERPAIVPGGKYTFYSEMQQEYEPPEKRLRQFTGQTVEVLSEQHTPNTNTDWCEDDSILYTVQASDGTIFTATMEELNGWDYDLGQYFWPDGTYGPDHDER